MMIFNMAGGGTSDFNLEVVGGTTQPTNAKANTIWVETGTPISSWRYLDTDSSLNPGNEGQVYIYGELQGNGCFNVVDDNNYSCVYIKPSNAKQYVNGSVITVEAYYYAGTVWTPFSYITNIPMFSYTGMYELVDDNDETLTDHTATNFKVRFLTSGTLTFTDFGGFTGKIDLFMVGGGAGGSRYQYNQASGAGAGGGYTATHKNLTVATNTPYSIVIGAGGSQGLLKGSRGGTTSAFGKNAYGGYGGGTGTNGYYGGNGGSGGGAAGSGENGYSGKGGSDGADGGDTEIGEGGTGQGTTTREFGDSSGTIYAGGGAGARAYYVNTMAGGAGGGGTVTDGVGGDGVANTGGGGAGSGSNKADNKAGNGGSGIVIIRNAR